MNANVHNKTTSVNKRLNGGRGKKKKRDVLWDVREPKRESQEHPSNSKSPGERKNVSVCSRSVLVQATCLQMLSKYTLHIYTNTQLPHITEQSERVRGGEREMQSEENNSIGRQHAAPASGWFVRKQADAPKLDSLHSCLLFDSSFKVGSAAS